MKTAAMAEEHRLEVKPISIQGKRLNLHCLSNWDAVVENLHEKGEEYLPRFPFWMKIWEASIVLADHLIGLGLDEDKQILELGAGMGITGLFLGAFGHKVTVTDIEDDAIALLQMNADKNGLDNIHVRRLDWNHPDLNREYDVICGSELVYREDSIGPLMNVFNRLLRPGGTVFLAHDVRRMCMMKFIGMVPGRYEIENRVKTLRGGDDAFRILIHTLRLKHRQS